VQVDKLFDLRQPWSNNGYLDHACFYQPISAQYWETTY